ncbi:hypothetical protein BDQ17DRAFT_423785 [Cyathus striatus]|nr:hypothetical protein BDQ17DRAFT_423785 [Cyathus striatus]
MSGAMSHNRIHVLFALQHSIVAISTRGASAPTMGHSFLSSSALSQCWPFDPVLPQILRLTYPFCTVGFTDDSMVLLLQPRRYSYQLLQDTSGLILHRLSIRAYLGTINHFDTISDILSFIGQIVQNADTALSVVTASPSAPRG